MIFHKINEIIFQENISIYPLNNNTRKGKDENDLKDVIEGGSLIKF